MSTHIYKITSKFLRSAEPIAPASFSPDKMEKDKRYAASAAVPESLLHDDDELASGSNPFSIRGQFKTGRAAYLDLQATTPLDPRVLDSMLPFMIGSYGNPHSRTHQFGWEAEAVVEQARAQVASLINASDPKEIIFTSGATESNNLAIKGAAHFYKSRGKHIITTQTEHKCVLDSCRFLETQEEYQVTYLPVQQSTGLVDMDELKAAIRPGETILVSIMAVNNEIGTLQPLDQIGELCRQNKILFHCDAAQMLGKLPIDLLKTKIDLMSMSSHKVYGPKGVGALYVRRRPRVRLEPIFSGGGQERGLRSGTLPHFLCAGFGKACQVAEEEMEFDHRWISYLSNKLQKGIEERIPEVTRNGDAVQNYMGCLNYSFAYVEGESLLMSLKNIAVSSGSACTSASLEPSYVLRALGLDDELAHSSLRFGIGRFTTEEEVDFVLELLEKHVERLREMSPLWEMVQEGVDLKSIQWTEDAHH
ncbi:cysteine desulfurase [Mayamaea pseudoterrestris]|nr:cysteine desulfurase [Mayamaea pseudoterrestris]